MDENGDLHAKIDLLGVPGAGKTCILSRFIRDVFNEYCMTTNGSYFCSKKLEIKDKSIILDIWDTVGLRKSYISLIKFHIKDADVIILVYDIT